MGLTVHFEVLNQLGTPMLYSDTLALRPAAGITGRIFYRTDSPFGIYRDNGVTWDLIGNVASGGITGSGVATRVAYWDTTSSISSDANLYFDATNDRLGIGTSTPTSALEVLGTITDTNTVTGITGLVTTATPNSSFSNNFTFNSGISTVASLSVIGVLSDNNLTYSGANTISATSYNASAVWRNIITFGAASASITYTQSTGIRALTNQQNIYIQSGANSGTISHYANFQIFGDQKLSAGLTTFTNRYQVLLNDYDEFSAGFTYTNRWAIYQAGSSNTNYFAGKVLIGTSTTVGSYQFDIIASGNSLHVGASTSNGVFFSTTETTFNRRTTISDTAISINDNNDTIGFSKGTGGSNNIFGTTGTGNGSIDIRTNGNSIMFLNYTNTNIGIGITSPSASAKVQINSTTQGFLPPVMTKVQRNAIASPASGLLVINSTDATLDGYDATAVAWYQSVRSDNGYVKVNATTSGTSGGASGQHLQINVNGTNYKIALLNV